jgi:hypothetical protein
MDVRLLTSPAEDVAVEVVARAVLVLLDLSCVVDLPARMRD